MRNETTAFHHNGSNPSDYCPTCHQLISKYRLIRSDYKHVPVMESLPDDYDACQLSRLSESARTTPVITKDEQE